MKTAQVVLLMLSVLILASAVMRLYVPDLEKLENWLAPKAEKIERR